MRNQPLFLDHYDAEWINDINGDLDPDSYGDRRFPDFHWKEPSFSFINDPTIIYQPEKLVSLLDPVISLCKTEGCGLRVIAELYTSTANTLTLWFELYMGIDRSTNQDFYPQVVFSETIGNIMRQTYIHSIENRSTAGYATNAGIDALTTTDLRLVDIASENVYTAGDQTYINAGSNPDDVNGGSGMNRSELGLTVSEVEEPTAGTDDEKTQILYDTCKTIGRNEIDKAAEEHAFDVVINPAVGPQYLTDYNLGDIITAMNARYGVSMDARISEVEELYEAGHNMQISLILGDPSITLLGRMKQISRRRG
jgi:hypothetical protein